jgi:hypothetical protein
MKTSAYVLKWNRLYILGISSENCCLHGGVSGAADPYLLFRCICCTGYCLALPIHLAATLPYIMQQVGDLLKVRKNLCCWFCFANQLSCQGLNIDLSLHLHKVCILRAYSLILGLYGLCHCAIGISWCCSFQLPDLWLLGALISLQSIS